MLILHDPASPLELSAEMLHDFGDGDFGTKSDEAAPAGRIPHLDDVEDGCWRVLDIYLAGWSEVDPDKIIAATAPGYCFNDPLVGEFSRKSLPNYFKHLRARFAPAGTLGGREYSFCFCGPVEKPLHPGQRHYFREAPVLGLTGVSTITIGELGVVAERVAYDLNLASDVLGRQQACKHVGQSHPQAEVSLSVP